MTSLQNTDYFIEHELAYEKLLSQIVATYFVGMYTICRIILRPSTGHNSMINVKTDLPVVVTNPGRLLSSQLHDPMITAIDLGAAVFIVEEEATFEFLDNFISKHDSSIQRVHRKFVLITLQTSEANSTDMLQFILTHPAVVEIANLLIVKPSEDVFELITHRFVGNYPDSSVHRIVDRYFPHNSTFHHKNNLFPNKLDNLMGKRIGLATFELLPWIVLRSIDHGLVRHANESFTLDGLDGYLLIQFCLRHNCTWELSIDQNKQYGQVFDNHTGDGMMGALLDRKVDFALAALGAWHPFYQYFSFSDPIMLIGVGCLTPKPRLIDSWKIVFLMFSIPVWIMITVTFIIISLFEYVQSVIIEKSRTSQRPKDLSRSFINVLGAFLLLPTELKRTRVSESVLSISLLLVTFITGYVYIGKIHGFLAIPVFQPPIDTIQDLAISNLPWYGPHYAWIYAIMDSENYYIKRILDTYRTGSSSSLQELANKGNAGLVLGTLNHGHFMVGSWLTAENSEHYRLMSELLYYEYDTGYATKTWPLLEIFNNFAMWTRDACLYRYIELSEVYKYMDYRVQSSIQHSRDRLRYNLKALALEEISGGLLLFGCGCLISAAVFAIEMIFCMRNNKN